MKGYCPTCDKVQKTYRPYDSWCDGCSVCHGDVWCDTKAQYEESLKPIPGSPVLSENPFTPISPQVNDIITVTWSLVII